MTKRLRHQSPSLRLTQRGVFTLLVMAAALLGFAVGLLALHVNDNLCKHALSNGAQWQITHYCGTEAGQ